MNKNLLLLLVLTLLFSCTEKTNNSKEVKTLKVLDTPDEDFDFESVTLIPLQTGENFYLGEWLIFKHIGNEFFVGDQQNQRSVFRFDENGKFLNRIGKSGNGPNEYAGLEDFIVYNDTVEILSGITNTMIYTYRTDGTFLGTKTYNLFVESFEKIGSNYVLYTSYNKAFHQYRMYFANKNGEIVDSLLKNDTQLNVPVAEDNFSRTGKNVYFKEAFNNVLYTFSSDTLKPTYILDFEEYNIPEDFYQQDMGLGIEMISKRGFAAIRHYFENRNYASFMVTVQKETMSSLAYNVLYNKTSKKLQSTKFETEKVETVLFEKVVSITENDELVYLIQPYKLKKNKEQLTKLPLTNPEVLNSIKETDNQVIAICKIKQE